jgi:hypothetical protein
MCVSYAFSFSSLSPHFLTSHHLHLSFFRLLQGTQGPLSQEAILAENFRGTETSTSNLFTVTIAGLNALTDYDVYCMSTSPLGTQMSMDNIYMVKIRSTTPFPLPSTTLLLQHLLNTFSPSTPPSTGVL